MIESRKLQEYPTYKSERKRGNLKIPKFRLKTSAHAIFNVLIGPQKSERFKMGHGFSEKMIIRFSAVLISWKTFFHSLLIFPRIYINV